MRKILRKLNSIIFWLFAAVLIAALAFTVLARFMDYELRAVLTASMEPEIPVGALILVVPQDPATIKVGDDIMFVKQGDIYVTHRVVENNKTNKTITTWGINNPPGAHDSPNAYHNVRGVVKLSVPGLGIVFDAMLTPSGKIMAITAITVVYLMSLMVEILLKGKEEKGKALKTGSSVS